MRNIDIGLNDILTYLHDGVNAIKNNLIET